MRNDHKCQFAGLLNTLPRRLGALGALLLLAGVVVALPVNSWGAWSQVASWGSFGSGQGQFNIPQQVAVYSTYSIYVADSENLRLVRTDLDGSNPSSLAMPAKPYGVAVDQYGYIYVSLSDNTVRKYQSNGTLMATASGTTLNAPRGLAIDPSGYVVYVADSDNNRIVTFDAPLLQYQSAISSFTGSAVGTFNAPVSVAVSLESSILYLYVSDSVNKRFLKFSTNSVTLIGEQSSIPLAVTSGITVDNRNNNTFRATKTNGGILGFDKDGVYNNLIPVSGFSGTVHGIHPAVLPNGDVLVSDSGNHRIVKFSTNPQPLDIVAVPKTGQTTSYAAGDDGALQAGESWPVPRFTDNVNGTMTDNLTGLIWSKDAITVDEYYGYSPLPLNFVLEMYIWEMNNTRLYKGFNDWRLPNINELRSLLNAGVTDKAAWLTNQGFVNVNVDFPFFSSTFGATGTSVWGINFGWPLYGMTTVGGGWPGAYVWPVRSSSGIGTVPLPRTGQTTCYNFADGSTIACNSYIAPVQDGEVLAGIRWPQPRFIDNTLSVTPVETLFDSVSGLTWANSTVSIIALCPNSSGTWQGALNQIACLNTNNYLGYNDWRLPNLAEAQSISNYEVSDVWFWLSQQGIAFPGYSWTSTTDPATTENAFVSFQNTYVSHSKGSFWGGGIAPVRGEKSGPGIAINNGGRVTSSSSVVLFLSATDTDLPLTMSFSNDGSSWSTAEAYAVRKEWTLATGADGIRTVYVKFADSKGNSPTYSDSITLDTTPPTISLAPGGGFYNNPQVTFSANEPSMLYFTINGSFPTADNTTKKRLPYSTTLTSTTTYRYYAVDAAGKATAATTVTYYIDTNPPTGSVQISSAQGGLIPPDYYTRSRDVSLSLSATDTVSQVVRMSFSDDGSTWTVSEPYGPFKSHNILSAGDGKKYVYVKYADQADNWSTGIISSNFVTLDSTAPTTTVSHTNVWYNAPVTPTLTCTDPAGPGCSAPTCYPSGCNAFVYSVDGSELSETSPFIENPNPEINRNFSAQLPIAISTNTDLRYVSLDRAENASPDQAPFPVQQFRFDVTAPTVALSTPVNGVKLTSLPAVSGTAADAGGSAINRVEVQISDGTNYVQQDKSIGSAAAWINIVPVSGNWSFDTSTMTNWSKPALYTITARAIDNAGNVSSTSSRTFNIWEPASTIVEFYPNNSSIQYNSTITLSGKLSRLPADPRYDLSGQQLRIHLTPPSGAAPPDVYHTIVSADGSFTTAPINGFTTKGLYTVTVYYDGIPGVLNGSTLAKNISVGSIAGYAVLIEGRIYNDSDNVSGHNPSHAKTAQRIYDTLKLRGFTDDNIYYFAYNTSNPGVDGVPDKTTIQTVLTAAGLSTSTYTLPSYPTLNGQPTLARKMNTVGQEGPLYIIFVDHGDADKIYIDNTTSTLAIPSNTALGLGNGIKEWLASLEGNTQTNPDKRLVILGSCYSGSFINHIQGAGRVIITSAAANEQSFKGGYEQSDNIRSGELFLEELFAALRVGNSFKDSFSFAADKVRTYTRIGGTATPVAPYFDDSMQHPLLDDDATGSGSNNLSEAGVDGNAVKDLYLGFSVNPDPSTYQTDADILNATATPNILTNAQTATTVRVETKTPVNTLWSWLEVRAPATTLTSNSQNKQLDLGSFGITRTALTKSDNGTPAISADDYFDGSYSSFSDPGKYELFLYAQESTVLSKGRIAPFKRLVVYKQQGTLSPPATFNLTAPATGSTQSTKGTLFSWTASAPTQAAYSGQSANGVTYTLEIRKGDADFNQPLAYKLEGIRTTSVFIGSEAGLEDLTSFYFWRVTAIDNYGNTRIAGNAPFTFKTDNSNLPSYAGLQGKVYDSVTSAPIIGATVRPTTPGLLYHEPCTTDTTGQCILLVDAGVNITFEATSANYQAATKNGTASLTVPVSVVFQLSGTAQGPAKIAANYFATLAAAYTAATTGNTIQLKAQTFTGPFNFNRTIAVTLEGGNDATYSPIRTGYTELTGPVTINGTTGCQVVMDRVVIR